LIISRVIPGGKRRRIRIDTSKIKAPRHE
jgi:hypothetical protein